MTLAFTHIPKTAGTTLNYLLQKNFGPKLNAIIPRKGGVYNYKNFKNDRLIYPNLSCISGHGLKPFIDYKEFDANLRWFTFLRDPIKRFVSQYIHQQTSSSDKFNMPIKDWASKYERSNWQVKWIAGEEDLEAAKQIIREKFIFIGLTERFNESLNIFKILLSHNFNLQFDVNYSQPKMVARDNSLKKKLLIDDIAELNEFYLEQNDLDIKLYDFVLEHFFENQLQNIDQNIITKNNRDFKNFANLNLFKLKRNLIYKPYVYLNK